MSRDKMLKRLSSYHFSMWEMRIYLDTHPKDCDAYKMLKEYKEKYDALAAEYEQTYGPLTLNGFNSDDWLCDPWPWDN